MSDLDPASLPPAGWLRWIRRAYGRDEAFRWTPVLDGFLARVPAESRAATEALWRARVGRSISEIHDEMMQDYLRPLRAVMRQDELDAANETSFAVFPTGEFEAYSGFTPRGDRVVVLHEGLVHSLTLISHWYLQWHESGGGITHLERADLHNTLLEYLTGLWHAGRPEQHLALPPVHPATADSWQLSHFLTMAAIAFVLGHEIGHVLHDHEGYTPDAHRNHDQEFEADITGLRIAARYALIHSLPLDDSYAGKFMLFGPYLAFGTMSLVSTQESMTHPKTLDRLRAATRAYPEIVEGFVGQEMTAFYDNFDPDVFEMLQRNGEALVAVMSLLNPRSPDAGAWDTSWLATLRRSSS